MTPIVMSQRLVMRPVNDRDVLSLYRGIVMPEINKWMETPANATVEGVLGWIRKASDMNLYWMICIKPNLAPIGCISLDWNEVQQTFELGWWLYPEYWHKGYMSETVNHVLYWLTYAVNVCSVVAVVAIENFNCIKTLTNAGFLPVEQTTYEKADGSQVFPAILYRKDLHRNY